MIAWRVLRVIVHLFIGLWTCAVVFPLTDAAGRSWRIGHWSAGLLRICRINMEIIRRYDAAMAPRALIVSNHVSWLDIFLINSMQPCRFVAKADIRDWPMIGWLCEKAGTIFIARGRLRDVRKIYQNLVTSIHAGEHVAFFPEGTTCAQGGLLPFHSNLFEAAVDAQVPIQPYVVRYVDAHGKLHSAVDYIGEMTFAESLLLILKTKGITGQLILLPTIATEGLHRRELSVSTRRAIAAELGVELTTADPERAKPGVVCPGACVVSTGSE